MSAIRVAALLAAAFICAAPAFAQSDARIKPARLASPGKPVAPIAVEHTLSAEPALGVPLTVTITARAEPSVGALTIEVHGDEALGVAAPPLAAAAPAGTSIWTVTVTPVAAGTGYLSVLVQGEAGGEPQARSLLIPIRVGVAKPAAVEPVKIDGGGEQIIALPAEESP